MEATEVNQCMNGSFELNEKSPNSSAQTS